MCLDKQLFSLIPPSSMRTTYNMLHSLDPIKAREILLQKLEENHGNVKKTARQFCTTPPVVRKWRDRQSLEDQPRTPLAYREPQLSWEDGLLAEEREKTNFGRTTIRTHMRMKYGLEFSDRHVRTVFKNAGLQRQKKKRSANGEQRVLYVHENLLPFEQMQVDTKHILDKHALPQSTYDFLRKMGLPCYQWTAIDIKTRIRFLAWSHECNCTNGKIFLELITCWMRAFGVQHDITIQIDNGKEFCMGSKRKEAQWNTEFTEKYRMQIKSIPPGLKYLQGYVERSHRLDDEYFYVPQGMKTRKKDQFLLNGYKWQCYYNYERPHHGKHMHGATPSQKLASLKTLINPHIISFPPFALEHLLHSSLKGGHDVPTCYPIGVLVFLSRIHQSAGQKEIGSAFSRRVSLLELYKKNTQLEKLLPMWELKLLASGLRMYCCLTAALVCGCRLVATSYDKRAVVVSEKLCNSFKPGIRCQLIIDGLYRIHLICFDLYLCKLFQ